VTATSNTRILILGVLFLLVMAVPVSADVKFQKTDDGKELISNGSYWIKWDPVSDHVVGDKFFINFTTNFPVGTRLGVEYLYSDYLSVKVQGIGITSTVEPGGNTSDYNASSTFINTTGLHEGDYLLLFDIINSSDPSIAVDFSNLGVYSDLELYPKNATSTTVSPPVTTISRTTPFTPVSPIVTDTTHEKNTTGSSASTTPKTPLSAVTAIAALVGSLVILSLIRTCCRNSEDKNSG